MKIFLVCTLLVFLSLNVQAQWYSRSFGVDNINDLNEVQLNYSLQKAKSFVKTGKILTFSGIGSFTLGTYLVVRGLDGWVFGDGNDSHLDEIVLGEMLILAGMGSVVVGVPFWIVGARRKSKIEIALIKFNTSSLKTLGQPEPLGLSLKINF